MEIVTEAHTELFRADEAMSVLIDLLYTKQKKTKEILSSKFSKIEGKLNFVRRKYIQYNDLHNRKLIDE